METVVIFDLDDTLYNQLSPFENAFKVVFKHHLSNVAIEDLFISSRKHSDVLFDKSEEGIISLMELQTYRIMAACKEFNLDIRYEEAVKFQMVYQKEQHQITLFPEIKKLIELLNINNIQLAILTNGPYQHQLMKIKQLGLTKWIPEENLFISEAIGSAKPHPEAFLFIEKQLNLPKNNIVFIGDSYTNDILGAKQVGWNAIWLNHRKRDISMIQPNYTFYSPKELLDFMSKNIK